MARSRNIKPGFFVNEELVELPFETRLLFIGLWTIADREGRLRDRPKAIKMSLFPADEVDVNESLDQLKTAGLILRYVIADERFIQVVNFAKHQHPHVNEVPSTIPAPEEYGATPVQIRPLTDSFNPHTDSFQSENPTSAGKKKSASRRPKKATTIPADFSLTAAMKEWANVKVPRLNIEKEFEAFVERAHAKGYEYKDWAAGWRTQMLKAQEWADARNGSSPAAPIAPVKFGLTYKPAIHTPHIVPKLDSDAIH